MAKRITLVAGDAGAIGFQLAKFLSDKNREICIQNRHPSYAKEDCMELKLSITLSRGSF